MYPVLLRFDSFTVYTFSVVVALAGLAGVAVAARRLACAGVTLAAAVLGVAWMLFSGFVAARVWWIVGHRGLDALMGPSWAGGLVWYGGMIGGALAATLAFHLGRVPWLVGADAVAPGLLVGLAIGRLGCHLAGDGDWGTVTALPWGVAYARGIAGWPHPEGVRVHPAPLYESIGSIALLALMTRTTVAIQSAGRVFWSYCIGAGLLRFVVEIVRVNPAVVGPLTEAQVISIVLVAIGLLGLQRERRGLLRGLLDSR